MNDRRLGIVVLVAGLLAIGIAQHATPARLPPLFDGVSIVEPYVWLVPPAGQKGDPKSAEGTAKVENGASPLLALATSEVPPQAQIFATSGSMILPQGATSIEMKIEPILPRILPTDGHIAGNVYRISVTDQAGTPLTAPASQQVTVVIRGPANTHSAQLEQLTDTGWTALKTEDAGFASTFLAVVTGFGDFALVAPGAGEPYPTATPVGGAPSGGTPSASASPTQASATPTASPSGAPVAAPTDSGPPPILLAGVVIAVLGGAAASALYARRRRERIRAEEVERRRKRQARPRRR